MLVVFIFFIYNSYFFLRFIRQHVFAFEPKDLVIKWIFVPESKLDSVYKMQSLEMFTPTTVSRQ